MTYSGEVASILSTFAKIIGVIFLMHILWLILQFCAVAPMSPGNRNPIRLLGTMLPAYFTALGTQSSAATIPVTLRQAEKLGVDPAVAGVHRAALRHHPHVRLHAQDCLLRCGSDDHARDAL